MGWALNIMEELFWATVPPPPLPLTPLLGVIFHVKNVNDVGFIFSLLKYIGFPIFEFWIFWILNISEDLRLSFYISCEAKEEINYQLRMAVIQIRTSKR